MPGGLAEIGQLGESQTEDLKVPGSITGFSIMHSWHLHSSGHMSRDKGHSPAIEDRILQKPGKWKTSTLQQIKCSKTEGTRLTSVL